MQIILENNVTHFKRYYEDVDVNNGKIYTNFNLDVSGLLDGEYTLYLYTDGNELATKELVRIGDYQIKEYKAEKKFTQYVKK